MKTIPSLVASSTVGIAAVGLVLGRPERSTDPVRPSSKKRKAENITDFDNGFSQDLSSPISRPGTSSTVITPDNRPFHPALGSGSTAPQSGQRRPSYSSNTRPESQNNSGGRRLSVVRYGEVPSSQEYVGEDARESVSSRGSWIRRFSTIPSSRGHSPTSSIGPDSPSLQLSHGSAAPILSSPTSSPAQLPPNKLVKRTISKRAHSGSLSRSGSGSQVPILRRPATSHQRSVTLQQQFKQDDLRGTKEPILEQSLRGQVSQKAPPNKYAKFDLGTIWRPYFQSRPTKLTKDRSPRRSSDGGIQNAQSTPRRVVPDETVMPTLVKPAMIRLSRNGIRQSYEDNFQLEDISDIKAITNDEVVPPPVETQSAELNKRARRSLSMNFSSPTSWMSRSGSLRGNKRNGDGRSGGKRYSSAPVATAPSRGTISAHGTISRHRAIMDPTVFREDPRNHGGKPDPNDPFSSANFRSRSRNSSSPLPPLSRLSSFNIDIARLNLSSSSSSAPLGSPTSPNPLTNTTATSVSSAGRISPTSASYFASLNSKPRASELLPSDRSTLVGSDNDARGFASGDEDDMDFQSETVYDSIRTGATGSIRSPNTPLDSMFDESPPSVCGHSKSKRLSVHEMLGSGVFGEGANKIVEEDEGSSTPIKGTRSSGDRPQTPVRDTSMECDRGFPSSPPSFCLANKDFERLSLDDAEEEDWNRDDENAEFGSPLSPPSSSLNSQRVSPSFRAALADVTHSGSKIGNSAPSVERPKSNVFEWSEPSSFEKLDHMGNTPRPKTAYVKQSLDLRGGRTIGRKGPSAAHIRSQSVPVVPDVSGQREAKLAHKFGTWGLGGKGVSEDWDGDFEFENNDVKDADDGGGKMEDSLVMHVPPAIQASQANVVGHVGQIREVCLLVEDLKRLRILGREKDLLDGASAPLWKEAEGIIALAVPDEEDPALSPPRPPSSINFDHDMIDERYVEHGPDGNDVSQPEMSFDILNHHGQPTGFVFDGNTVRRRSVFSPEDDIFGTAPANIDKPQTNESPRPKLNSLRQPFMKNSADVARSVMETMHQHRSASDPLHAELATQSSNKMPFDTTSLRDLVHRASVLTRMLADLIRKADGIPQSPECSPHRDSSPAFTRVFTDPMASPPKHLARTHSNNSILSGSIDGSPARSLGQRMHMMTVV